MSSIVTSKVFLNLVSTLCLNFVLIGGLGCFFFVGSSLIVAELWIGPLKLVEVEYTAILLRYKKRFVVLYSELCVVWASVQN